ncbi:hypothetical protein B5F07_14460 [Lachnoclostridium sp. An169]|nr:hypothetical protein B5F07_14460 [Lachnoclostridium sp. An169]
MAFARFKEREEMSMKNDDNKIKDVRNTANLISGAYTLPLIEKLFSNSQKISDMDDIYFAIAALVDTGRISEAFHMMRGLFGIAGMEWPQEITQLEKMEELQEVFASEFIFDFYDVIEDKRLETEEEEIPV